MTLQTSGAISLAQIQTEFGGASPIALSEYYAGGGYVPAGASGSNGAVPASGAIALSKFYGTSKVLDSQTLTVGYTYGCDKIGCWVSSSGYWTGGSMGSMSDGTSNIYGGAGFRRLDWDGSSTLTLGIEGNQPNSGWTSMNFDIFSFARASAFYVYSGGYTWWQWSCSANPFTQSQYVVVWQ